MYGGRWLWCRMPGGVLAGKMSGFILFMRTMPGGVFSPGMGFFSGRGFFSGKGFPPGGVVFPTSPMPGGVISTRRFLPRSR